VAELPALIPRHAESLVAEALADTRVVLVNGARQAGKSTLTRLAADRQADTVIRLLDDPAALTSARADPTGFVDHKGLMVIDEIQLVPELSLLAGRASGLLVPATLAGQSGIPRTTLVRYLELLGRSFSSRPSQPGRPDRPNVPSAPRNWPSSTPEWHAISSARTRLGWPNRVAPPDP
jgi:hypothetical protein